MPVMEIIRHKTLVVVRKTTKAVLPQKFHGIRYCTMRKNSFWCDEKINRIVS